MNIIFMFMSEFHWNVSACCALKYDVVNWLASYFYSYFFFILLVDSSRCKSNRHDSEFDNESGEGKRYYKNYNKISIFTVFCDKIDKNTKKYEKTAKLTISWKWSPWDICTWPLI